MKKDALLPKTRLKRYLLDRIQSFRTRETLSYCEIMLGKQNSVAVLQSTILTIPVHYGSVNCWLRSLKCLWQPRLALYQAPQAQPYHCLTHHCPTHYCTTVPSTTVLNTSSTAVPLSHRSLYHIPLSRVPLSRVPQAPLYHTPLSQVLLSRVPQAPLYHIPLSQVLLSRVPQAPLYHCPEYLKHHCTTHHYLKYHWAEYPSTKYHHYDSSLLIHSYLCS